MACLYKLTFPNGKSYIGITTKTAEKRAAGHRQLARRGGNTAVSAAIRKWERFECKTLVVADIEYLKDLEPKAIKAFDTLAPKGYNLGIGGDFSPMLNPEVAAHAIGNKFASRKGKPKIVRSAEYLKKLSASLRGNKNAIGNSHGVGNRNAAGKRTAEQIENIKRGVAAAKLRKEIQQKGGAK